MVKEREGCSKPFLTKDKPKRYSIMVSAMDFDSIGTSSILVAAVSSSVAE